MTDKEILDQMAKHYILQMRVIEQMRCALWMFEHSGDIEDQLMWDSLFRWCEAKDERDAFWLKFRPYWVRAFHLREGPTMFEGVIV